MLLSALGTGKTGPEQARHQRRSLALRGPAPVRAESFGSLKTEEKTNASAGSESTTLGSDGDAVCQFRGRFPPVTNTNEAGSAGESSRPDLNHPADRSTASITDEIHVRDVGLSHKSIRSTIIQEDGGEPSRFLMESLILAQDERWRRA